MPASTEVRSGLQYGWTDGEDGWGDPMNQNLLRLGRAGFHLSVLDRNLATPPATPSAGDTYIVAATATDAWLGHEDEVAIWDGAAWVFYTPRVGWVAYIEDEAVISAFKATGWSAGVSI